MVINVYSILELLAVWHTLDSARFLQSKLRTTEIIGLTLGAINLKIFPDLKNLIEFHGVFFVYTIFAILFTIWGALTIPDNRGKSLVKVEDAYEKKLDDKIDINES